MFTLRDLVLGVLLPLGLTAGILALGRATAGHRFGGRGPRAWIGPLGMSAGFGGGYLALFGSEEFPPLDVTGWLFYLLVPLVATALLDQALQFSAPVRGGSVLALAMLAGWLFMRPTSREGEPWSDALLVVAALAGLVSVWAMAMDTLAERVSAARLTGLLLAALAPACLALLLSGSQRLAQIGGILAATQGGVLIFNLVWGQSRADRATLPGFAILYGGLLLCGNVYAELPTTSALLLYFAPALAWPGNIKRHPFRSVWLTAIETGAVLAVGACVVLQAWRTFALSAG